MSDKGNELFEDLTPIDDVDLGIYKDALDKAFYNDKIKNIAITGPYGSGKSSVLETYKKKSHLEFCHISLAYFDDMKGMNSSKDNNINTIEVKIINQLLQQIDSSNIPQTQFKIKKIVIDHLTQK